MGVETELDLAQNIVAKALPHLAQEDLQKGRDAADDLLSSHEVSVPYSGIPGLDSGRVSSANRPPFVMEWLSVSHGNRTARSFKTYNIKLDPFLALRTFLGSAKDAGVAGAAGGLGTWLATGAASVGGLIGLTVAALGFIAAGHFAARRDIQYEHGCLFVLAWAASEYIDGRHIVDEAELLAQLPSMKEFEIFDYNEDKARTVLGHFIAWGMMDRDGPAYILRESVKVWD